MSGPEQDLPALQQYVAQHVDGVFDLAPDLIHMNTMLIASPPRAVRDAIARHQQGFNENPVGYFTARASPTAPPRVLEETERAARAAARYLGLPVDDGERPGTSYIAQTGSTTMGLALLANGIRLRRTQEVVSSVHDYSAMRESWQRRCDRSGSQYREIRLYRNPGAQDLRHEILENVEQAIRDETRVLSLTWVHSSTGVKLPIAAIGRHLRAVNAARKPSDHVLFLVDGVHGFGVEFDDFPGLTCDFFVAGCHKWIFGPRGTGVVCALPHTWGEVTPTIPTALPVNTAGAEQTPGGVQNYEHVWAVAEAFDFHLSIGKRHVAQFTHALADRLKRGLAGLNQVEVLTPLEADMSSGIVCCDVSAVSPDDAVARLRNRGILAMTSSEDADGKSHLRFSPSILNTPDQVDRVIEAVSDLVSGRAGLGAVI